MSDVRLATLTRVLARHPSMAELLTHLHQYAVESAGGRCSVLLQTSPRTGLLHPTSAFGLDTLSTDAWFTDELEQRLARTALGGHEPMLVENLATRYRDLASHLGTKHALLVPLQGLGATLGLLTLGLETEPFEDQLLARVPPVADAFVLAIERLRLQRDAELQRDLRALLHDFSRQVSATLSVRSGLESFCVGATRLFGADRTTVWLHDRDARELRIEASSDRGATVATSVPAGNQRHPAARAMRTAGPQLFQPSAGEPDIPTVAVGLRGRRRALGTLVFEGMRIEPGEETDVLARSEEVGLQLAAAIETTQLLEQVLQRGGREDVR